MLSSSPSSVSSLHSFYFVSFRVNSWIDSAQKTTIHETQLDDDLTVTDKIGDIRLLKCFTLIENKDLLLGFEWNSGSPEFNAQCLLVNRFQKATT